MSNNFSSTDSTSSDSVSPDLNLSAHCLSSAVFDQFEPVSISSLLNIVKQLRPTFSSSNSIPSHLLKDVLNTVAPII